MKILSASNIISILSLLYVLDLKMLGYYNKAFFSGINDELVEAILRNQIALCPLFLIFPFFTFILKPILTYFNRLIAKKAIYVVLRKNNIDAVRVDTLECHRDCSSFSTEKHLINDPDKLIESFRNVIYKLSGRLAPYVIVTVDESTNNFEMNAIYWFILEAGAHYVSFADKVLTATEARKHAINKREFDE